MAKLKGWQLAKIISQRVEDVAADVKEQDNLSHPYYGDYDDEDDDWLDDQFSDDDEECYECESCGEIFPEREIGDSDLCEDCQEEEDFPTVACAKCGKLNNDGNKADDGRILCDDCDDLEFEEEEARIESEERN